MAFMGVLAIFCTFALIALALLVTVAFALVVAITTGGLMLGAAGKLGRLALPPGGTVRGVRLMGGMVLGMALAMCIGLVATAYFEVSGGFVTLLALAPVWCLVGGILAVAKAGRVKKALGAAG